MNYKKSIIFIVFMSFSVGTMLVAAASDERMVEVKRISKLSLRIQKIQEELKKYEPYKKEVDHLSQVILKLLNLHKHMSSAGDRDLYLDKVEERCDEYEQVVLPRLAQELKPVYSHKYNVHNFQMRSHTLLEKGRHVINAFKKGQHYAVTAHSLAGELEKVSQFLQNKTRRSDQQYERYEQFLNNLEPQLNKYLKVDVPKIRKEILEKNKQKRIEEQQKAEELRRQNSFGMRRRNTV